MRTASDDAINIQDESHDIWIDHCDFTSAFDGLVDIKRGSDFVTVSWNTFTNNGKTSVNLKGHLLTTLVDRHLQLGTHRVDLDASNIATGIYFYVIQTGDFIQGRRMTLVK